MRAEQAEAFNKSGRRKLRHSQMDWSRQGRQAPHLLSVAAIPDLSAPPHLTYVYVNVCLSMFTLKAGGFRLNARPYNKLHKVTWDPKARHPQASDLPLYAFVLIVKLTTPLY